MGITAAPATRDATSAATVLLPAPGIPAMAITRGAGLRSRRASRISAVSGVASLDIPDPSLAPRDTRLIE